MALKRTVTYYQVRYHYRFLLCTKLRVISCTPQKYVKVDKQFNNKECIFRINYVLQMDNNYGILKKSDSVKFAKRQRVVQQENNARYTSLMLFL